MSEGEKNKKTQCVLVEYLRTATEWAFYLHKDAHCEWNDNGDLEVWSGPFRVALYRGSCVICLRQDEFE